jgi:hypothetical protein
MTATTRSAGDGTPDPGHETSLTSAPEAETVDSLLVGMASPDRCAECGAEIAVDQRYCVECGNRRGPARFSIARSSSTSVAVLPQAQPTSTRPPAIVMVATGVVIALLALGVGVLIGHDGSRTPVRVGVSGGGTAAATSGAGATKSSGAGSTKSGGTSTTAAKKNFFGS